MDSINIMMIHITIKVKFLTLEKTLSKIFFVFSSAVNRRRPPPSASSQHNGNSRRTRPIPSSNNNRRYGLNNSETNKTYRRPRPSPPQSIVPPISN